MIEALFAKLKEWLPAPPYAPMWLGAQYANQRDAPVERIVVIPDSESFDAPDAAYSLMGAPDGSVCASLATRVTTFETRCWGKTFDSTEALMMTFLRALRRCVSRPALVVARATWARPDWETIGEVLSLFWSVRTQVWAPPDYVRIPLDNIDTQCGCELKMEPFPVPGTLAAAFLADEAHKEGA